MEKENKKYKYLDKESVEKILKKFTDEEEIYLFFCEFVEMSKLVSMSGCQIAKVKSEYQPSILANIVVLITDFYKENIEIIHEIIKVTEYIYLYIDDRKKFENDYTEDNL